MNKLLYWQDGESIDIARQMLLSGSVILADGDTVPGLISLASKLASGAIDLIKQRKDKQYIVLVSSLYQVKNLCHDKAIESFLPIINSVWPGPVTLIFPANEAFFSICGPTVAVRMPKHAPLRDLIELTGPLFSTSANISGQPTPNTMQDVGQSIKDKVVLIIEDKIHSQENKQPSALIDCTGSTYKVIRYHPILDKIKLP